MIKEKSNAALSYLVAFIETGDWVFFRVAVGYFIHTAWRYFIFWYKEEHKYYYWNSFIEVLDLWVFEDNFWSVVFFKGLVFCESALLIKNMDINNLIQIIKGEKIIEINDENSEQQSSNENKDSEN